ncbi:DUF547 domain-containing protein [Halovivax sp.]|uniref:DUF547 domain-containing protein n=1 Tax=Halovivax sp. TaxID=1935978 RepID=UPI0025C2A124|nr:DUF547 domain-containing protein [Halovivax sp.]
MSTQLDPLTVSADLLYSVKTGGETRSLRERLAGLDRDRLERTLADRPRRLSFWLNAFNAYAQLLLERDPSLLSGGRLDRWKFFARDRIPIAGAWLSLNDLRDGILRSSSHRWGLGYLPRPFPSRFERRFRLEECDPRIHFALSTGAESSPPIAVYSPEDVEEELDVATEWYLEENVSYDRERDVATVPRLFRWYQGDFGGPSGIRQFLKRYDAVPTAATPSLEYDDYDWSVDVERFST